MCVWLRYAGLLTLEIGERVSGRIVRRNNEFTLTPEIRGGVLGEPPPFILERGGGLFVCLRLRLLDAEAAELRKVIAPVQGTREPEVELIASRIRISMAGRSFDGSVAFESELRLPEYVSNLNPEDRP